METTGRDRARSSGEWLRWIRGVRAALLGLLVLLLACGAEPSATPDASGEPVSAADRAEAATASQRAAVERAAHIAAVQAGAGPEYRFVTDGDGARATLPTQRLHAALHRSVLELWPSGGRGSVPSWRASLRWTGVGRGASIEPVAPMDEAPALDATRASYLRADGREAWYLSGPLGVEQGFVLPERPRGDGEVMLEVTVGGDLTPVLEGQQVALQTADGTVMLRYTDLVAHDATGRALRSRLEVADEAIRLVVDDHRARYPLSIDPLVWVQLHKLVADDGAAGSVFGTAVSLSADTAIIGSYLDDSNGSSSGSAYAFVRTAASWNQQQKLLAADGAANDHFGGAASLSGDSALIGARNGDDGDGSNSGAAYVFVRSADAWTQQQKLLADDRAADDGFGVSVALAGDTALVGAPYGDDYGTDSGAAYVFVRSADTWTQQQKILATDGEDNDRLGVSVALAGDTALVGASDVDDNGTDSGAAYVFVRSADTWTQQDKLIGADTSFQDAFGSAVSLSISGDAALVGAREAAANVSRSGAAYVFVRSADTWTQQDKLIAADGAHDDLFGLSVSLSADAALVGASRNGDFGTDSGSAYVFVRSATTWTQRQKLLAVDSAAGDQFGRSVSLSADTALVGAHRNGDLGADAGAAYIFGLANSACEPCPGPDGDDDCAESCDEATGTCTAADPPGATCDDGVFCNGADSCTAGVCDVHPGDPCLPLDTTDYDCAASCNEEAGACTAPDPDGTACRDEGTCRDGSCTHGDPVGQPCTEDEDCAEGLICSADGHCERPGGTTGAECTDDADCAAGLTCSADGHCEESSEPATDSAAPTDEGGCGCRLAGEGDADDPWPATLLVALGLLAGARRRWPHTSHRRSP